MAARSLLPPAVGWEGQLEEKAKLEGWDKESLTEQQMKRKVTTIILIKRIHKARNTQCDSFTVPCPARFHASYPTLAAFPSYIVSMTSCGIEYPICLASLPGCVPSHLPLKINSILAETRTHGVQVTAFTHSLTGSKYPVPLRTDASIFSSFNVWH